MAALMDLVAGDAREILLVLSVDDTAAFDDRARFDAHLPLGAGLDPTWLDLFCEAARAVRTATSRATSSTLATSSKGPGQQVEYTVEYVDAGWVATSPDSPTASSTRSRGAGSTCSRRSMGVLSAEEKPSDPAPRERGRPLLPCGGPFGNAGVFFAWSL